MREFTSKTFHCFETLLLVLELGVGIRLWVREGFGRSFLDDFLFLTPSDWAGFGGALPLLISLWVLGLPRSSLWLTRAAPGSLWITGSAWRGGPWVVGRGFPELQERVLQAP